MAIKIRLGETKDLQRISIINSFGTEAGRLMAEKELPRFINSKNLFVAEIDAEIVGLLYWEQKFFGEGNWFLTQVTIGESWRRKGIGESLVRYFLTYAKEHGAKKVFADIRESNLPSVSLNKKLGAVEVGYLDLGDGDPRKFYRFNL